MTTAEEAASAATLLRQKLSDMSSVRLIDIGVDMDTSHYVRVWVRTKTPEIVQKLPHDINGVAIKVATL